MISEINPYRIEMARAFGIRGINPNEDDLKAWVEDWTGGAGADLVFEVSGSPAGARITDRSLTGERKGHPDSHPRGAAARQSA